MTETLEAPAATTQEGGSPAPETTGDSSSPKVAEQQTAPETVKLDPGESEKKAEPKSWDGFELQSPKDFETDPEARKVFAAAVREAGLDPDAAQKVLDAIVPALRGQGAARIDAMHEEWQEAIKADKTIGGDKLEENLGIAKKALDTFGDDDLRKLLNPTNKGEVRLGDHPAIVRMLLKVGKAIRPDSKVVKGQPQGGKPMTPEERLAAKYARNQ